MELLYIWIEDYKNIKRQGFNFSAQYRFEFTDLQISKDENDKEIVTGGTLKVTDNQNYIPNFFGKDITNVTAIVGENGSGKSSLLEVIQNPILSRCFMIVKVNIFFLMQYESGFHLNSSFQGEDKKILILSNEVKINNADENPIPDIKNALIIDLKENYGKLKNLFYFPYLSNSIDNHNGFWAINEYDDISTTSLFSKAHTITTYQIEEIRKQAIFLGNFDKIVKEFLFLNSDKIFLEIRFLDQRDFNKYEKIILSSQFEETEDYVMSIYLAKVLYVFINFQKREEIETEVNGILSSDKNIATKNKEILALIISVGGMWGMTGGKGIDFSNLRPENVVKWFRENINEKFDDFKPPIYLNVIKDLSQIESFCKAYQETPFELFRLNWVVRTQYLMDSDIKYKNAPLALSNGENALISIFSRIYNNIIFLLSRHEELNSGKLITILFDEPDLGLHPQWQKKLLKYFIDFIPEIFAYDLGKGKQYRKLQFILTSHSPFLVSDLPKDHVIFLEKGEDGTCKVKDSLNEMKQTFGANIHTLLTDSFFMKGGLMGEFAKEKIQHLINYLNRENLKDCEIKTDEQAQQYLNIIGEPIIKNFLQKQLDSRRLERVEKKHDARIKYLEEELERLRTKTNLDLDR